MFELGEVLRMEACAASSHRGELRDLAASVILQGLHDLCSSDAQARASAVHFIRRDGGGIWADYLGVDRALIRAAKRPLRSRGGRPRRNAAALTDALRDDYAAFEAWCAGLDGTPRVEQVLAQFGVTRSTAYRWLAAYEAKREGVAP